MKKRFCSLFLACLLVFNFVAAAGCPALAADNNLENDGYPQIDSGTIFDPNLTLGFGDAEDEDESEQLESSEVPNSNMPESEQEHREEIPEEEHESTCSIIVPSYTVINRGESCTITALLSGWTSRDGYLFGYSQEYGSVRLNPSEIIVSTDDAGVVQISRAILMDYTLIVDFFGISAGTANIIFRFPIISGETSFSVPAACEVTVIGNTYSVYTSAGPHGSISPDGMSEVEEGEDFILTVTADAGYCIDQILVNGAEWNAGKIADAQAIQTVSLTNIREDQTITASFKSASYTVTACAEEGGTITPSGTSSVPCGGSCTLTIRAGDNWYVDYVTSNNDTWSFSGELKSEVSITLDDIREDKNVTAHFVPRFTNPFKGLNLKDFKNPFLDVSEDDWYYEAVAYLYMAGLLDGVDFSAYAMDTASISGHSTLREANAQNTGVFSTAGALRLKSVASGQYYCGTNSETRANTVISIYNGAPNLGLARGSYANNPFCDVSAGHNFYKQVLWANYMNIVQGYGNGCFGPNDGITREQMCAIILRTANKANFSLPQTVAASSFNDSSNISSWAYSAVAACQRAGIIEGFPDGSFRPKECITRAQVDTMILRFFNLLP